MRCPNCGAPNEGTRFCTYCGNEMPHNENMQNNVSDNAHQTIINNYYYSDSQSSTRTENTSRVIINNGNASQADGFNESQKDKIVALLLCFFFGGIGVHYFYVGRWGMGLLYFFTGGLCGIGWLVDLIRIAVGSFPGLKK